VQLLFFLVVGFSFRGYVAVETSGRRVRACGGNKYSQGCLS